MKSATELCNIQGINTSQLVNINKQCTLLLPRLSIM